MRDAELEPEPSPAAADPADEAPRIRELVLPLRIHADVRVELLLGICVIAKVETEAVIGARSAAEAVELTDAQHMARALVCLLGLSYRRKRKRHERGRDEGSIH